MTFLAFRLFGGEDGSSDPTTTPQPATVTSIGGPTAEGSAHVELYVLAKSGFDRYTESPSVGDQTWMREHYEFMTVWSPYFDSRLSWFPKGVEYSDVMALKGGDRSEWILKDSSGDLLYVDFACSGGSCPQYAADVGNQSYRNWFIAELKRLTAKGYAGFYLDDVNMSWRISNGSGEAQPVDPRTGETMTLEAWRRYMADFVEQIEREVPGIIVHNALWTADSPGFDDPRVARQLAAADWIQIEHGYNDPGLRGGNGTYSVRNLFAYVDWVHSLGTKVMWLEEDGGTQAKHESNLAAYLLTYAPGDVISTEDWAQIAPGSIWEGYLLDLGPHSAPAPDQTGCSDENSKKARCWSTNQTTTPKPCQSPAPASTAAPSQKSPYPKEQASSSSNPDRRRAIRPGTMQ